MIHPMKTGGPAFPSQADNEYGYQAKGMELRDYFAAKVLSALLIADGTQRASFAIRAKESYEIADAMLEERAK